MKILSPRQCQICKQCFTPLPQHSHQKYCSNIACKKAGKRSWHKNRMQTDPIYKENQALANKKWQSKNLNYYNNYRQNKKKLVENVELLKQQLQEELSLNSANYKLTLIEPLNAKMDVWIIKFDRISIV